MNKHLKPGVAVALEGLSKADEREFMRRCVELGGIIASASNESGANYLAFSYMKKIFRIADDLEDIKLISINQALGRESEVENTWFERGDLPPVGTVCQIAASTEYLHIPYPEGSEVKVYSNFTDDRGTELAAFVCPKGKIGGVAIAKCFRPLKTEKEKFVELLFNETGNITENEARALYDKGLRFTE